MRAIIIDFIHFLKVPKVEKPKELYFNFSFLKLIFFSFLILLAFDIITGILFITPLKHLSLLPSQKEIYLSSINILKISLLLPIIEELIFRLPLKISKLNFVIPLSLLFFLFLIKLVNIYFSLTIALLFFFSLALSINKKFSILYTLGRIFTSHFKVIFYIQALAFGILHLTNFNLDYRYIIIFPLLIINQLFTGCYLGYLRIRFNLGIYVCIFTHMLINTLFCLSR